MNIDERENYGQNDLYFQDEGQYKDDDSVSNVLDNSINDGEQDIYNQQDPDEDYRDPDDMDPDDLEDENFTDADDLDDDLEEDDIDQEDFDDEEDGLDDDLDDLDDDDFDEDDNVKNKRELYRDRDL
jgi:hypothetical protein